jgi:hypothetical protein
MLNFSVITQENLKEIAKNLADKEGHILIVEPGPESWDNNIIDAQLSFFNHPFLNKDWLSVKRGHKKIHGEDWQTNWEGDRDYILRPRRKSTGDPLHDPCCDLFEGLAIGSYEFKIGFQGVVGRSVFGENGISLYVPKSTPLKFAFCYGLSHIVKKINAHNKAEKNERFFIGETDIGRMAEYAAEDLINGRVFRKNVDAGMEADRIYEKI